MALKIKGLLLELLLVVFLGGLLAYLVQSEVHHHDFVLTEKNFTRLCETKKMMVVNESFPGPTIYVRKGDRLFVNVHNQAGFKLTIHWHGVKQPRNPWSDGPEYITQCAIKPGTNFTYEVILSDEVGTLWWHAHSDWTTNTVHGAIIIYPGEGETLPFPEPDGQQILILGSWYTYDVNLAVEEALETGQNFPYSPDAYTINGQPGDFNACSKDRTYRFSVDYGKTYLLRIVNAEMNSEMFLAISGHSLTVVSQDAAYLKPFVTDYIVLGPGQTMDVLVTANQTLGQYYVATRKFATDIKFELTDTTAILQYNGNYSAPESPQFPSSLPLSEDYDSAFKFRNKLRSLTVQDVPNNITTGMYIVAAQNVNSFNRSGDVVDTPASSLNNLSFVNPWMSVLQAYYGNMTGFYTEDFPDDPPDFYDFVSDTSPFNNTRSLMGTKVKVLEFGEEVEIVFQSSNVMNASEDHPLHLHGHAFYKIGAGSGNFKFDEDPKTYNLVDPPYVNTAIVPKSGWLAVRFRALNPGVWLWHCHFDHHLSWGMDTAFIVKNGPTPETSILPPPPSMPPCDPPIDIKQKISQFSDEKANA